MRIICDWEHWSRANRWGEVLARAEEWGRISVEHRVFRPYREKGAWVDEADEERTPQYPFDPGCDVLIVNWDSVNGDPTFGADFSLRWFEHRRLDLLVWILNGGVLVIEGQASNHVPDQRSYDALLGPRELLVSGHEDPGDPGQQRKRLGDEGRLTSRAGRSGLFPSLASIRARKRAKRSEMFPDDAPRLPSPELDDEEWGLYRGWFRHSLLRRRRFAWVQLVRTSDRRRFHNHPIMMATTYGQGAIYASTMLLATSDQVRLVESILRTCGRASHLPAPRRIGRWLRSNLASTTTGLAAAVIYSATAVLRPFESVLAHIAAVAAGGLAVALVAGASKVFREISSMTGR